MMEYSTQFLLMELESVGNIRLEEGCSTDPWYYRTITFINKFTVTKDKTSFITLFICCVPNRFTSCWDLLLSHFPHSDFKVHGITGIRINGVIRIHNSALRLRFEDKFHSLLASDESTSFSQSVKVDFNENTSLCVFVTLNNTFNWIYTFQGGITDVNWSTCSMLLTLKKIMRRKKFCALLRKASNQLTNTRCVLCCSSLFHISTPLHHTHTRPSITSYLYRTGNIMNGICQN